MGLRTGMLSGLTTSNGMGWVRRHGRGFDHVSNARTGHSTFKGLGSNMALQDHSGYMTYIG